MREMELEKLVKQVFAYKFCFNQFTLHMKTGVRKRLNIHSIKSGSELISAKSVVLGS